MSCRDSGTSRGLLGLCFAKTVTFVTSLWRWDCWGAAGELLEGCWGLLGAAGDPLFLKTRHFCPFPLALGSVEGLLGSWGPFVSQNPSLLSLPFLLGTVGGLLGSWGPFVSQNPSLLSLPFLLGTVGGLLGSCWRAAGDPLFLKTRHFCHFSLALGAEPVTSVTSLWRLLGSWGLLGVLGAAGSWDPLFSKPVTSVTSLSAGGLLGAAGSWELGTFCFSKPVTLSRPFGAGNWVAAGELLEGCWGLRGAGSWGPIVSQNPSPLSLLVLGGLLGSWGLVSQNPSLLSLRVVVNWVWLQIERLYMHHRGK